MSARPCNGPGPAAAEPEFDPDEASCSTIRVGDQATLGHRIDAAMLESDVCVLRARGGFCTSAADGARDEVRVIRLVMKRRQALRCPMGREESVSESAPPVRPM
jgi:hypothetical protein